MPTQRQVPRGRRLPLPLHSVGVVTSRYRPRRMTPRDSRGVTLRAIVEADATEIVGPSSVCQPSRATTAS